MTSMCGYTTLKTPAPCRTAQGFLVVDEEGNVVSYCRVRSNVRAGCTICWHGTSSMSSWTTQTRSLSSASLPGTRAYACLTMNVTGLTKSFV